MRIIFLGTPEFAVPPLAALADAGHDIVCVVTQPDRPSGRRRCLAAPPAKAFALERGLLVRQAEDVNAEAFVDGLAELRPDAIVVAAFGQKLGRRLLALPPLGCINVHASLLPRHRGAAPVAHAILAGDAETGVTIMRMGERIDTGDILGQEATPIGPRERAGELAARLAALGACLLIRTLSRLAAGKVQPIPQDSRLASRAPALSKGDGAVDWNRPAPWLARFVRAMHPWPGAFTFWRPQGRPPLRLVLHEAEAIAGGEGFPGRIAQAGHGTIQVVAGEGVLSISRLQPAGGRPMGADEFLRGHRVAPGDSFGPPPGTHETGDEP